MHLTREKIELERNSDGFHSGAEVIFVGKIRNHSEGRQVLYLVYEAYEAMAERMIESLIEKAQSRWAVDRIFIQHRLGLIELGETAVLIEVHSAHRDEAYQASRFLIEEIKHQVPIWKKEFFEDGTGVWSRCTHQEAV